MLQNMHSSRHKSEPAYTRNPDLDALIADLCICCCSTNTIVYINIQKAKEPWVLMRKLYNAE